MLGAQWHSASLDEDKLNVCYNDQQPQRIELTNKAS